LKYLFEIEIFTVTFHQFNEAMQNKTKNVFLTQTFEQ